jgi:molecular chaperone DnaJ
VKEKCPVCKGEGRVDGENSVDVQVPPGVEQGHYITLGGKGHAGKRGGAPGDLYVIFEEKPHPFFKRVNNDIHYNLTIPFTTAALGGEVEIPTIDGDTKIEIAAGTQPNSSITLKNLGVPFLNRNQRGNLIVNITVKVPTKLNAREKELLQELASSDNFVLTKNSKKHKDFFDKVKETFF